MVFPGGRELVILHDYFRNVSKLMCRKFVMSRRIHWVVLCPLLAFAVSAFTISSVLACNFLHLPESLLLSLKKEKGETNSCKFAVIDVQVCKYRAN